jgi:hypothetical protein
MNLSLCRRVIRSQRPKLLTNVKVHAAAGSDIGSISLRPGGNGDTRAGLSARQPLDCGVCADLAANAETHSDLGRSRCGHAHCMRRLNSGGATSLRERQKSRSGFAMLSFTRPAWPGWSVSFTVSGRIPVAKRSVERVGLSQRTCPAAGSGSLEFRSYNLLGWIATFGTGVHPPRL